MMENSGKLNCESFVDNLLENGTSDQLESITHNEENETQICGDTCDKQDGNKLNSAIWTTHATSVLLKLYDNKLEMLETPKKKTRIWIAISENLRNYNIEVTPDQVRWKINALTKKYKHCISMRKHEKFKYFKEMDNIYSKYNVDCDSITVSDFLTKMKFQREHTNHYKFSKSGLETRAMIDMRKARLASRIESDISQGKIMLEKQWLEYLHKQEDYKQWRYKLFENNLKYREEKLQTWKKELQIKESFENRKLQLMEKEQTELLQIEREKCELLKQMFFVE